MHAASAAERILAKALAIPTIAGQGGGDSSHFRALHDLLRHSFPRLHSTLVSEVVGEAHALMFVWHGSARELRPWAILAHQDVVGIDAGTETQWTHPPFAGAIADGSIWGRGALDMKSSLVAVMQAVEDLIASGFAPRRTLMLCLGGDEETGGGAGAACIAARLRERGLRLAMTLDEGGSVVTGAFPGVRIPVALIGIAQKGELVLELTAEGGGGHAAMPEPGSAIERLAACVLALQRAGLPAGIRGPSRQMLLALSAAATPAWRLLYRLAAGLGGKVLQPLFHRTGLEPLMASVLTVTRFSAGFAANVVPQRAAATIDIRLRPGDSGDWAIEYVRRLAHRHHVRVETLQNLDPSPVSSTEGPFFHCLRTAILRLVPEAAIVPYLSPNDADSRHFADVADAQYRFIPTVLGKADLARIHGTDERIPVATYRSMVDFYQDLVRVVDAVEVAVEPRRGDARPCP